jgi:hypothetical protein
MSSISNLSGSYLQSLLNNVLQDNGLTNKTPGNSVSSIGAPSDNGQLSPFAQLVSTLQQLQQSDPTKYKQVTQQIATNLQSAAQTAQTDGNSNAANQLNQLAADFTSASQSGQLPNIQDLAQATGGGHHHHHHFHSGSADQDSNSSSSDGSSTSSTSSTNPTTASGSQNNTLNPFAIILNTLSSAGIGGSSNP